MQANYFIIVCLSPSKCGVTPENSRLRSTRIPFTKLELEVGWSEKQDIVHSKTDFYTIPYKGINVCLKIYKETGNSYGFIG